MAAKEKTIKVTSEPTSVQENRKVTLTVDPTGLKASPYLAVWDAGGRGNFEPVGESRLLTVEVGKNVERSLIVGSPSELNVAWLASEVPAGTTVVVKCKLYEGFEGLLVDERIDEITAFLARSPEVAARGSTRVLITPPWSVPVPVPVALQRTQVPRTDEQALWVVIRNSTEAMSFNRYRDFMDRLLCLDDPTDTEAVANRDSLHQLSRRRALPFSDVDPYRLLKTATELFLMLNCGVEIGPDFPRLEELDADEERLRLYRALFTGDIEGSWSEYVLGDGDSVPRTVPTIPYLELVRQNLSDAPVITGTGLYGSIASACYGILREKLTHPCFIELIWSYWHEEGMLVQTMNAITWRFQNRKGPVERDPLALVEIDPLRPLNNYLWGYIQDEQHRLTIPRRAYEYDHHYGITLFGKAVPAVQGADSRPRFIEALHNLLYLCAIFFKEDDDTTVVADGFPILNALKEVHLLLTQGAHNQYRDLPWTARLEMLMEQWLLARPEFRDFLPRRVMVDYPEPWMQSVETMKTLQGWTDTSVLHFWELGRFGERILLSARFHPWTQVIHPEAAANWARYWRAEIQGYMHAYRAVTGVDLTDRPDATMPGVLLRQRLPQRGPQMLPGAERLVGRAGRPIGPRSTVRQLPSSTSSVTRRQR